MKAKVTALLAAAVLVVAVAAVCAYWYVRVRPAAWASGEAVSAAQRVRPGMPIEEALAAMRPTAQGYYECTPWPGTVRHVFVYAPPGRLDLGTEVLLEATGEPGRETVRGAFFKDTSERNARGWCS